MFHAILCGGGRTVYLKTNDCGVLYASDDNIISKKYIPLYINEFGEGSLGGIIDKDFKLNKEKISKSLKMFIENSFI